MGLTLSLAAALAPALWTGQWADRAQRWGLVFGEMLALTMVVTVCMITAGPRHPAGARRSAARAKVEPE
jgi:Na+(H+)/acetate symporter ActP